MRRSTLDTLIAMLGGAMLAAGVVGGLMLRIGGGRRPGFRTVTLPKLAEAIVGNSRTAVASVLGPPRIATFVGSEKAVEDYRHADVWYYPLPREGQVGMAIRFNDENAEAVEFFSSPR
jgi:hypothetical protein